jgi:hypothetical protein
MDLIWISVTESGYIECISLDKPSNISNFIQIHSYPSDLLDRPSYYYLYIDGEFVVNNV